MTKCSAVALALSDHERQRERVQKTQKQSRNRVRDQNLNVTLQGSSLTERRNGMIEHLYISNVRLFEGPTEWTVPLSPMTVFCGTNSAGKSTILKALLLLCQTQSNAEVNKPGRISLAGGLVDFGSYQSLVSHNNAAQNVMFGITVRGAMKARSLQSLLRMQDPSASSELPSVDSELAYTLSVRFTCGLRGPATEELTRSSISGKPRTLGPQRVFLKEATFEFSAENDLTLSWRIEADPDSEFYHILLPIDYFSATYEGFELMDIAREPDSKQARIEAVLRGLLPIGLWAQSKRKKKGASEEEGEGDWTYFPLPPLLTDCSRDLEQEFDKIHYLGPLRSPARRYYMTSLDLDPKMDPTGEFLPYVLRDRRDQLVYHISPGGTQVARKPLKNVLDSWMCYLRTGQCSEVDPDKDLHEIDITSTKDVLLELAVKTFGGEAHGLADSGFGYSQILPIVVRGLIAPVGSTIIIEQPELHLNPAIQVRLAEFLMSLVVAGRRLLVETHSEHIVNSLRVLSAEDPTGQFAGECKVVYVNTESGKPQLLQLDIQPDGTIPEWPRQFFGEALTLSTRLLKAQNKKARSQNK